MKWLIILLAVLSAALGVLAFTHLVSAIADLAKVLFYISIALLFLVGAGAFLVKRALQ